MKKWLTEHFLPMWAKETVLADNRHLWEENRKLKEEIRQKDAYIQGQQNVLRYMGRIRIYNRGGEA